MTPRQHWVSVLIATTDPVRRLLPICPAGRPDRAEVVIPAPASV